MAYALFQNETIRSQRRTNKSDVNTYHSLLVRLGDYNLFAFIASTESSEKKRQRLHDRLITAVQWTGSACDIEKKRFSVVDVDLPFVEF